MDGTNFNGPTLITSQNVKKKAKFPTKIHTPEYNGSIKNGPSGGRRTTTKNKDPCRTGIP